MQAVPSEFLAIDRKERANRPFFDLDLRAPEARTCDFDDVVIEFDPERAMVEAARCIHLVRIGRAAAPSFAPAGTFVP